MIGMDRYRLRRYPNEMGISYNVNEPSLNDFQSDYDDVINFENSLTDNTSSNFVDPDKEATFKKYIGTSVSLVSLLAENLLSHPFVVLRRQCQVHNKSIQYHVLPVNLVPVICHLHRHQGLTTLWKGLGSALLVRGMTLGVEDLLSKITPWPKEMYRGMSVKSFFQHIFLKGVSFSIIMPYYCASLVETVQSDIASEKPGMLDVFREGTMRLFNIGGNSKGRMLPVWILIFPTITFGIIRYLFTSIVKAGTFRLLQVHTKESNPSTTLPKDISNVGLVHDVELNSSLIAIVTSDIVFYPFETILHRLYLQGTRTIIDNLDSGKSVVPILTNYNNPTDCFESCLSTEGVFGLYKGFGALTLQYMAHIFLVQITKFLLTEITAIYRGRRSSNLPIKVQNELVKDNQLS